MLVEIFIHRNCSQCAVLLEFLKQRNLLHSVKLVDTELYPFVAIERGVLSTPSVFVDGKLIFAGLVDLEQLEEILIKGEVPSASVELSELADKLMRGVADSFALSSWLYVNLDFDALMAQRSFVEAVTGLALDKEKEIKYSALRNVMLKDGLIYFEKWKLDLVRNIGTNFVRELYWLYERKMERDEVRSLYPLAVFAHWVMVRGGAVGRVGLRIHPVSDSQTFSRIKEVYDFVFSTWEQLWDKVISEQSRVKQLMHSLETRRMEV
jgi:predicted thioredoxin/glutaredoxin